MVHIPSFLVICFTMLPALSGEGEGHGYTAVDDNKGCIFLRTHLRWSWSKAMRGSVSSWSCEESPQNYVCIPR
jgi:hypothetical protein